jgi:hypothetical protein
MNFVEAYELKSSCLSELLIYSQNQKACGLAAVSLQIQTKYLIRDPLTPSQLCVLYSEAETPSERWAKETYELYKDSNRMIR